MKNSTINASAPPRYDATNNRTRQPFDSAKVRFLGGAAAITDALARHVRAKGVNVQLDCTVDHISTAHFDAVQLGGVQVWCRLLTCSSLLMHNSLLMYSTLLTCSSRLAFLQFEQSIARYGVRRIPFVGSGIRAASIQSRAAARSVYCLLCFVSRPRRFLTELYWHTGYIALLHIYASTCDGLNVYLYPSAGGNLTATQKALPFTHHYAWCQSG